MTSLSAASAKISRVSLVGIAAPGVAVFAWEVWYQAKGDSLHGVAAIVFLVYALGVVSWTLARLLVNRRAALTVALGVLVLGYMAGFFLASAGPVSVFPAVIGLGGTAATLLFGR